MKKAAHNTSLTSLLAFASAVMLMPGTVQASESGQQPSPDDIAVCTKTEGCILAEGHEGDCVLDTQPVQTPENEEPKEKNPSDELSAAQQLQARIDALPSADELAEMTLEEQQAVDAEVSDIYNAIDALTEGKDSLVLTKLEEAAECLTGLMTPTAGNPVAEVEGVPYDTLKEAMETATEGQTVVLISDTEESAVITVASNITLDLNGHTITNLVTGDRLFYVTASGFTVNGTVSGSKMEIPDTNTGSYGFIKIAARSVVTLNGGTYTGNTDNGAFIKIFRNASIDASGSTVNLNNVTMDSKGRFISTDTLNTDASTPTLQVTGGTYTTEGMAFGLDTLQRSPASFKNVAVNAGTGPCIEVTGAAGTFEDCTFTVNNQGNSSHYQATAIAVSYDGTAVIDGGTYTSTGYGAYAYSSGGTITIKDGTVKGGMAAVKADVDANTYQHAKSSVIVEGGRTEGAWLTNGNKNATLTAIGGSHTVDISAYLAEGALMEQLPDGSYAVRGLKAPTVSIAASASSVHAGSSTVLTAKASHELGGVLYSYQWYKDGALLSGKIGNTLTVTEAGSYTVKVKASEGVRESAEVESDPAVITAEGHTFEEQWGSDDKNHWHTCAGCGTIADQAAHTFAWVTDKEATATEAGSRHEECTICGYAKKAVEIPATGTSSGSGESSGSGGSGSSSGSGGQEQVVHTPKTSDNSNAGLWLALAAGAALTGAVTFGYSQRKKYRD